MKKFKLVYFTVCCFVIVFSCKDVDFITDSSAKLTFSVDTITFDTVFTSIGSTTKQLRVYNNHNQPIKISEIYLAGRNISYFRLNIDGDQSDRVADVEIRSKDSLYIFVEITVDPLGVNNPLVIKDSIVFITNGNVQDVNLVAYGQDVHLVNGEWVETTTWTADKPYLIYNSIGIDTTETLTIEKGAMLYFHDRSRMYIFGTLLAEGTKENPIVFRGDRLDYIDVYPPLPYDNLSDQWGGIWFLSSSKGNRLNYCNIRNANIGIQAGVLGETEQAELEISNSIVENHSFSAMFLINSKMIAKNCLIANCGSYLVSSVTGGYYEFYQCTLANYYSHFTQSRSGEPSVLLSNQVVYLDSVFTGDLEKAGFYNCIITGSGNNELRLYSNKKNSLNYKFDHCLLNVNLDSIDAENTEYFSNVIFNDDPNFKSTERYEYNFELDTLSGAKDKGDPGLITLYPELQYDINGELRTGDAAPDLGAYERIE